MILCEKYDNHHILYKLLLPLLLHTRYSQLEVLAFGMNILFWQILESFSTFGRAPWIGKSLSQGFYLHRKTQHWKMRTYAMPRVRFKPTTSTFEWPRPTPQTARPLVPATRHSRILISLFWPMHQFCEYLLLRLSFMSTYCLLLNLQPSNTSQLTYDYIYIAS
jgi:hypothetical protein